MILIVVLLGLLATYRPALAAAARSLAEEEIGAGISVVRGPVNGVLIRRNGETLAIYGDPRPAPDQVRQVLFTHYRRDVVWAGRVLVDQGAEAIAPEAEKPFFIDVAQFWQRYKTARFHDYENQSTRVLGEPLKLARTVRGGDTIDWHGVSIRVLDTPGCTRGSVSYLVLAGGKRSACVGDLIYGDGQLFDLFSLQDAVPQMWDAYHGYAARAADVIRSLRNVAEWKPDLMIPARGPLIDNPGVAIESLIRRLEALFASHFAIDALRWYSGDSKFRAMAARVLPASPVEWMPTAAQVSEKLPGWIIPITNSRLIVSRDGSAFLVDCGNRKVVEEVQRLNRVGEIKALEGLYITHYHDDHTDMAQTLADRFQCPIYFCRQQQDILEHPEAYHMPCLSPNGIRGGLAMKDGVRQRWHEFEFTYSYFPGQTLYHGGLLVKKDNGETVFFIGDAFSPTGMDDYCMLNRNFLEPEEGYLGCLNRLRTMHGSYLLINQHVPPAFRFSSQQLDFMIATFRERRGLISALVPWDDPNFGLDEQWARFYPYAIETSAGAHLNLKIMLRNHGSAPAVFHLTPHVPAGWESVHQRLAVRIGPHQDGFVNIPITVGQPGLKIVTADVAFGPWDLREWTEALVSVK